ncbi:MAG: preprotein translocase subunit SecY [Acetobacteraceae bacterium]|nr:preprotein translocase subunit SecY [Acetobacteraceae bacterium]
MLDTLRSAMKIRDLRNRVFFTLYMFIVFRVGAHVPVPGIDPKVIEQLFATGTLFGLLDLFSGGALKAFSIFAMSITPYINATIIMQLLTVVIPRLEKLAEEGVEGRKRLTQYTRYATTVLALIQAVGMAFYLRNMGALLNPGFGSLAIICIVLTAGTTFLMWLGEQITEHGIGNGISLLIFAGIVARLPAGTGRILNYIRVGTISWFNLLVLLVGGLVVIAAVVWIQEGRRKIPVQYAKRVVGRRMVGGASTHIPVRVNTAGVIPVIFAQSVIMFPATIAAFVDHPWARAVVKFLDYGTWPYLTLYFLLIVFFTYFYTAVVFNPNQVSNNIRKYGGFIPGLRPGRPTAQHLEWVLNRITLAGAIFLALIAIMPSFFEGLTNIPNLYFGGTALLIVVGVALETMKQIEAHLLMRHYEGFIK